MSEPSRQQDGGPNGPGASETGEVLVRLAERLRENQVFGPAVERGGTTVVPVAQVRAGGGLGGPAGRRPDQANGGFGFVARPLGAWVVDDAGKVTWQPAVDVTRLAVAGQALTTAALVALTLALRGRRRTGRTSSGGGTRARRGSRP